jgi:ribosomal protein S18 acetylase RimI-like enzyme
MAHAFDDVTRLGRPAREQRMRCRKSQDGDIPAMAEIRAGDWGTEEYWRKRMCDYLTLRLHPQKSRLPREAFVCVDGQRIAGLIAGHLTRRFGCAGELEWISVRPEYRGSGAASQLLRRLAKWFIKNGALKVCVDVEPNNTIARRFYARHGAIDLKPYWMIWKDITAALKPRQSAP